jgi:hypothetical protein
MYNTYIVTSPLSNSGGIAGRAEAHGRGGGVDPKPLLDPARGPRRWRRRRAVYRRCLHDGRLRLRRRCPEPVAAALVEAGFKREGRHWIHADAELFVEFPGGAVQAHEKTAILEVGGVSVLTLSPEDLIVDRLAAWQFWRSTTDGASAYLIWKAQARNIERGRLAHLAKRRGVEKGLARLDDFIRSVGSRTPSAEELETWANRIP